MKKEKEGNYEIGTEWRSEPKIRLCVLYESRLFWELIKSSEAALQKCSYKQMF